MSIVAPGTVAFGMQLPIQSQSTLYAEPWEATATPSDLAAIAKNADDTGFLYVAVCDHISIPPPLDGRMGTTWYDTIATLGWLAALTTRVRLLSHVWVAPYRHPLVSAKAFATLDHLSGGRVLVGVGAGHVEAEFTTLGVDFHRRGKLLDESIDALDVALRAEYPSFDGPTWSFSGGGAKPVPVQDPRPPIWVGGSSPAALRRAAHKADGWLPQGTPRAEMPSQIAELKRLRESGPLAGQPIDVNTVVELLHIGAPTWDVGEHTISGEPDKIAASLREYGEMGVNVLQVRFRCRSLAELLDQMDAFTADVAPHLA